MQTTLPHPSYAAHLSTIRNFWTTHEHFSLGDKVKPSTLYSLAQDLFDDPSESITEAEMIEFYANEKRIPHRPSMRTEVNIKAVVPDAYMAYALIRIAGIAPLLATIDHMEPEDGASPFMFSMSVDDKDADRVLRIGGQSLHPQLVKTMLGYAYYACSWYLEPYGAEGMSLTTVIDNLRRDQYTRFVMPHSGATVRWSCNSEMAPTFREPAGRTEIKRNLGPPIVVDEEEGVTYEIRPQGVTEKR